MRTPRFILEDGWDVVEETGILASLIRGHSGTDPLKNVVLGYRELAEEIKRFNISEQMLCEDLPFQRALITRDYQDPAYREGIEWGERLTKWREEIHRKSGNLYGEAVSSTPSDNNYDPHYKDQFLRFNERSHSFSDYLGQEAVGRVAIPRGGMRGCSDECRARAMALIQRWLDDHE